MNSRDICPMSEVCGGCIYQGVPYAEQLESKDRQVRKLLINHNIDIDVYEGMKSALTPYGYRNKMEYTFGDLTIGGELELGMHKKGHFMSIITTDECQLVPEDFNRILRATREFCIERGYTKYHKKTHEGLLRNLIVRCGVRTNELLIDIVTTTEEGFDEEAFTEMILGLELDKTVVGVLRTFNDSLADAVYNQGTKILFGRDYYNEEILGLKFKVNTFAFFQTNIDAIERLYSEALALIPNIESKTVYDLYCGTGTITQLMALKAAKVYGVEIVEDAVEAAKMNAELNGIDNCEFICGDVKAKLSELTEKPDMIVVDPPRMGMHDKVVDMLAAYDIPEILYISCNPKTMSMNLERFATYGYKPVVIKAYDNFAMTKHAECVCLLRNKKSKADDCVEIGVDADDYYDIKAGSEN